MGKVIKWTEEEDKMLIQLYSNGVSYSEIASLLGRPYNGVVLRTSKLGIAPKRKIWLDSDYDLLATLYETEFDRNVLIKTLNTSWHSISAQARKLGLYRPKVSYTIVDMENIDTEFKAYSLGLIAADGYISPLNNKVSVTLHKNDEEFLYRWGEAFCSPAKFYYRSKDNCIDFYLYDEVLFNKLMLHNITPAKSKTLEPPKTVPENLIHHWIRGLFDGDGSISAQNTENRLRISFASTKSVLDFINSWFMSYCPEYHYSLAEKNNSLGTFQLLMKSLAAHKFLKLMYKDANWYLPRKYAIAKPFIESEPKLYFWTEDEINILVNNFSNSRMTTNDLALLLPSRNVQAIRLKAYKLGLTRNA